jgi:hypothetical protein
MLSKEERDAIRKSINQAVDSCKDCQNSTEVFGVWGDVALRDAPRLLDALDKAEQEMERLREVIARLYKVVNLASLTECDHRCLTRETQHQLFALLSEALAVMGQSK